MAEYIEREKAKTEIMEWARRIFDPKSLSAEDTMHVLSVLPAADVVEVVRCRECVSCKHCYPAKAIDEEPVEGWRCEHFGRYVKPDDFCSYGERRKNE